MLGSVGLNHKNDKVWMRLCREVLAEAKKVTELGGGKVRFVTFDEKGGKDAEKRETGPV